MKSELEKFYAAIESIDTAMMTTRRQDGHLRSRAMANQKKAAGRGLVVRVPRGHGEADRPEIRSARQPDVLPQQQPRVGCRYPARPRISKDRDKIRELYAPDWKMWFGDERRRPVTARPTIRASC
jgi:general stress protein 26